MSKNRNRPDQDGKHRAAFDKNKRKIYASQSVCGICGKPVDMSLKSPHPLSKCIDHIIPIARGGHPSAIENLQLAHRICNMEKGEKILRAVEQKPQDIGNRVLPQLMDWKNFI